MKKKQKAEPESRRKSSYKGNSRNNSKSGGLTFSEKKRLIQLKHILSGKSNEKEKPTTAQKTITFEKMPPFVIFLFLPTACISSLTGMVLCPV